MADKIAKFEDYKKRDNADTTEIDIQIEDPYNFFNEEEREEYFKERQKEEERKKARAKAQEEAVRQPQNESAQRPVDRPVERPVNPDRRQDYAPRRPQQPVEQNVNPGYQGQPNGRTMNGQMNPGYQNQPNARAMNGQMNPGYQNQPNARAMNGQMNPGYQNQPNGGYPNNRYPNNQNYQDRYDPDEDYEGYEDDYDNEPDDGVNMELIVRVSSIITGIIILAFVALFVKVKVFDKYFAPDPDEQEVVVTAIPDGFVEKNDTVTVEGASSLNLRSGPSTDSAIVGKVDEGTQLSRIAVSQDGSWALVDVNGQQVYASMKYLKE